MMAAIYRELECRDDQLPYIEAGETEPGEMKDELVKELK